MTIISPSAPAWTWSPEVLEFARQAQVADYLDPLLEATRDLFPQAGEMRIFTVEDPEIEEDRHITWELPTPFTDVADYVAAQRQWIRELCRICPAPLTCVFRLTLVPVPNGPA